LEHSAVQFYLGLVTVLFLALCWTGIRGAVAGQDDSAEAQEAGSDRVSPSRDPNEKKSSLSCVEIKTVNG
jgi:hypothetical protein